MKHTPYSIHAARCTMKSTPEANFPLPPPPWRDKKRKKEKETPLLSYSGLVQRRPGPAFFSAVRPPSSFSFFSHSSSFFSLVLLLVAISTSYFTFSPLSHFVVIPPSSLSLQGRSSLYFRFFWRYPPRFFKKIPFLFRSSTASLSYDFLITLFFFLISLYNVL